MPVFLRWSLANHEYYALQHADSSNFYITEKVGRRVVRSGTLALEDVRTWPALALVRPGRAALRFMSTRRENEVCEASGWSLSVNEAALGPLEGEGQTYFCVPFQRLRWPPTRESR